LALYTDNVAIDILCSFALDCRERESGSAFVFVKTKHKDRDHKRKRQGESDTGSRLVLGSGEHYPPVI